LVEGDSAAVVLVGHVLLPVVAGQPPLAVPLDGACAASGNEIDTHSDSRSSAALTLGASMTQQYPPQ